MAARFRELDAGIRGRTKKAAVVRGLFPFRVTRVTGESGQG
jgi:hypothetical protein